ncbi:MAG: DUF1343 domain-containing protein [Desulfobacterales bacterium]
MNIVKAGLEEFADFPPEWLQGLRLGLLCNPASVDRNFCHARMRIDRAFPGQLCALYSPQHGFFAEKQDNMVESNHLTDPVLGIPAYSLYGKTRIPTADMLEDVDVLLVDLQDAGTRVYTFIYTLSFCMEAAKKYHKQVLVLDRPNPIGGIGVEGNCLCPEYASFVGRYPIPMRHGLTVGELALLFNEHFGIGCDLRVIPMRGWRRSMYFRDTGLPWVAPSPNLPTPESAMVYPGQVIWEGTNISEGRGTTQPFELFGAPFLDTEKIKEEQSIAQLPGAVLRSLVFEPTSNKWAGKSCRGFQIHVTNPGKYLPYLSSLCLLQTVIRHHSADFEWKKPPYEYEFEKMPMDLIIGDRQIRERIEQLDSLDEISDSWQRDLKHFCEISRKFHLYS